MASEEFKKKYFNALATYERLHEKNQGARNKIVNTKQGNIPAPITEDELISLKKEREAWDRVIEIARHPD